MYKPTAHPPYEHSTLVLNLKNYLWKWKICSESSRNDEECGANISALEKLVSWLTAKIFLRISQLA